MAHRRPFCSLICIFMVGSWLLDRAAILDAQESVEGPAVIELPSPGEAGDVYASGFISSDVEDFPALFLEKLAQQHAQGTGEDEVSLRRAPCGVLYVYMHKLGGGASGTPAGFRIQLDPESDKDRIKFKRNVKENADGDERPSATLTMPATSLSLTTGGPAQVVWKSPPIFGDEQVGGVAVAVMIAAHARTKVFKGKQTESELNGIQGAFAAMGIVIPPFSLLSVGGDYAVSWADDGLVRVRPWAQVNLAYDGNTLQARSAPLGLLARAGRKAVAVEEKPDPEVQVQFTSASARYPDMIAGSFTVQAGVDGQADGGGIVYGESGTLVATAVYAWAKTEGLPVVSGYSMSAAVDVTYWGANQSAYDEAYAELRADFDSATDGWSAERATDTEAIKLALNGMLRRFFGKARDGRAFEGEW